VTVQWATSLSDLDFHWV